jgi:hypothetical protein
MGTKSEIVHQLYSFGYDEKSGTLWYKIDGYPKCTAHSYSKEYTNEERHNDTVNFLFRMLPSFKCLVFSN